MFFDSVGIKWVYEPEGYDLDGEWYIPDFYLPDSDSFLEIKGPAMGNMEKVYKFCDVFPNILVGDESGRITKASSRKLKHRNCTIFMLFHCHQCDMFNLISCYLTCAGTWFPMHYNICSTCDTKRDRNTKVFPVRLPQFQYKHKKAHK
jgi:hypothetical protein